MRSVRCALLLALVLPRCAEDAASVELGREPPPSARAANTALPLPAAAQPASPDAAPASLRAPAPSPPADAHDASPDAEDASEAGDASAEGGPQDPDADASATADAAEAAVDATAARDDAAASEEEITVRATPTPPPRAASDMVQVVGGLRHLPAQNATELLARLAPGILLTNEGGEGHAEQIYLRGFDAREGQDLEFTVEGIPINEAGNPHGEGYADTHFLIPELVYSIRVLEGPFDPRQGNYAAAGSVDYRLGLTQRGLSLAYSFGSFNTHRVLALWGPEQARRGTFVGAEFRSTDGYGSNRAALLGRALAQYEFQTADRTVVRLLLTGYGTRFQSAGVLRQDDVAAGRVDFFGTYDPTQGGDGTRFTAAVTVENDTPHRELRGLAFATLRTLRIRANYTGFVQDPPAMYRSGIVQRGDLSDQSETAFTVGSRGSLRLRAPWRGLQQSLEVGYYLRHDEVDAALKRDRFGTDIPYRVDSDLAQSITNMGLYADVDFRPVRWLAVRGGVRGDLFFYNVLDRCALHDTALDAGVPVVDMLCYTRDRAGTRDPQTRRSAQGFAAQPRGTLVLGPFEGVSVSASGGLGSRAADPSYLGDSTVAPFATIAAAEAGVLFDRRLGSVQLNARALYYFTHSNRDLLFNQQEGRNTLAPGTRRQGALVAVRATGRFFDVLGSLTYADARFERQAMDLGSTYFPPDAGDRVPYVPPWVARLNGALFGAIPRLQLAGHGFDARLGVGFSYISPRALLYGEWSDPIVQLDASAGLRYRWIEVGISGQNLLNQRYRQGEYNYVSEFNQAARAPDLIAARHFTAGAPLSVFGTLTLHLPTDGGASASRGAATP